MSENYTVQDVFNTFYPGYQKTHELSAAQRKADYHELQDWCIWCHCIRRRA